MVESEALDLGAASPDGVVHTGLNGGGCSIATGAGQALDPLLPGLAGIAGPGLFRRRSVAEAPRRLREGAGRV